MQPKPDDFAFIAAEVVDLGPRTASAATGKGDLEGRRPSQAGSLTSNLYNPFAETFVFSGEQFLGQIVGSSVDVFGRPGEMMIDSRFGRAT